MTFLSPLLLGGAALIAVPIVLHLIMRQQPKRLEFPALRLLQQRQQTNRRKLQFRHLLLLALRCLVIALLAAALARPSIQASGTFGDGETPVAAALVFDTGARMEYVHQNKTRLAAAKETGDWLLSQLPAESEAAVLDSRLTTAGFAVDLSSARRRINRLTSTAQTMPWGTVTEEALRLLGESAKPRHELYIFTDLSEASWSPEQMKTLRQRLADAKDVGIYLVDVGVKQPENTGIDNLRLSAEVISQNRPLSLQANVVHSGEAGQRAATLYLLDSTGEAKKRGETILSLADDGTMVADFRLGNLQPGIHQGYIKLDVQDPLSVDNTRFFTVQVQPAWRVLIAATDPPDENAYFLKTALTSAETPSFECDVVSLKELATRNLPDYASICILDPRPLPADTWHRLAAYASAGGGVAIFLGHNAQPLEAFNAPAAQELLPAPLRRQWRAGNREIFLAPSELQHPILAKFRETQGANPWQAFPVYRHWQLGKLIDGVAVVMPYNNTLPAILERPVGNGRVIAMTTPVSDPAPTTDPPDSWNLIPTGEEPWPFVMLANEMLYYLVGSSAARVNYLAGDTAVLPLGDHNAHPMVVITTPRDESLRQSVDEKRNSVAFTSTESPGNYRVQAGGKADGVNLGFSVNYPADVSRLKRIEPDKLKEFFGDTPFQLARTQEEINRNVSTGRVGRELYPLLILLVALLLGGEQILANRFYRQPKKGDLPAVPARPSMADWKKPAAEPPRPLAPEPAGAR